MTTDPTDPTEPTAIKPGDEAAAGTPGSGDNVCPDCSGSGKLGSIQCPACEGTGVVQGAVGGA